MTGLDMERADIRFRSLIIDFFRRIELMSKVIVIPL